SARRFAVEPNGSSFLSSLRPQVRSPRPCFLRGCRWKALPWSYCVSARAQRRRRRLVPGKVGARLLQQLSPCFSKWAVLSPRQGSADHVGEQLLLRRFG